MTDPRRYRVAIDHQERTTPHAMISTGDYIFYTTKDGGTHPTIAARVGNKRIYCELPDGRSAWVSKTNCQLQEEWAKDRDQ